MTRLTCFMLLSLVAPFALTSCKEEAPPKPDGQRAAVDPYRDSVSSQTDDAWRRDTSQRDSDWDDNRWRSDRDDDWDRDRDEDCSSSSRARFSVNGREESVIRVDVGRSNEWRFEAEPADRDDDCDFKVFHVEVDSRPPDMNIMGTYSDNVRVSWNLNRRDRQFDTGRVTVYALNMTACAEDDDFSRSECEDFGRDTQDEMSRYVVDDSFRWTVDGNGSGIGGNGNSSNTVALGAGISVISALLSGQDPFSALFNVGTSMIGGGLTNQIGMQNNGLMTNNNLFPNQNMNQWPGNQNQWPNGNMNQWPNGNMNQFPNSNFPGNGQMVDCQRMNTSNQCRQSNMCRWDGIRCETNCSMIRDRQTCQQARCTWDNSFNRCERF